MYSYYDAIEKMDKLLFVDCNQKLLNRRRLNEESSGTIDRFHSHEERTRVSSNPRKTRVPTS